MQPQAWPAVGMQDAALRRLYQQWKRVYNVSYPSPTEASFLFD